MTLIEKRALQHLGLDSLDNLRTGNRVELQARLDEATSDILGALLPRELIQNSVSVYDDTVEEYERNPHNRDVVDGTIEFMNLLREGNLVLDIGCATGRDVRFMACPDHTFRASLMQRNKNGQTTFQKYQVPTHALRVWGIDGSVKMVARAMDCRPPALYAYEPVYRVCDMHDLEFGGLQFDGVHSCTSAFTHTPFVLIDQTMQRIASLVRPGGIFFVSYTNGFTDGRHSKLLLSSTGRIKWFSQPDPEIIEYHARKHGFDLINQSLDDYVSGGTVKKDLFVSQLFRKTNVVVLGNSRSAQADDDEKKNDMSAMAA